MARFADLHTHILPRFDDGSRSSAESVAMLRALYAQGAESVVLTPHFYARKEEPKDFLAARADTVAHLVSRVGESAESDGNEFPRIFVGAEVEYFSAMSICRELENFCIGNTKYMLCEMPFERWTSAMIEELRKIKKNRGITPIIAHIERYCGFFKPQMLDEMIAEGFIIQSNAEAFLGFGRGKALKLLSEGKIHVLGSDSHNMEKRAPNMSAALDMIEKKLGAETVKRLCDKSIEIINGAEKIY